MFLKNNWKHIILIAWFGSHSKLCTHEQRPPTPKMRKSTIYSELVYRAQESATTSHIRLRLRAGIGMGMSSGRKQGTHVLLTACEVGKLEADWQDDGRRIWELRRTYWYLSLPHLVLNGKDEKWGSCESLTKHWPLRPIAVEVEVSFSMLFAAGCGAGPCGWSERFPDFQEDSEYSAFQNPSFIIFSHILCAYRNLNHCFQN